MNAVTRDRNASLATADRLRLGKKVALGLALATGIVTAAARADDAASLQAERMQFERNAAITGKARVTARFSQDFTGFAGSSANADSLVTGLRSGTPITLAGASGPGGGTSSLTFSAPTRPMGYGNVYISLALAKEQLASLGITQPTPDQIKAALVGGTVTTGGGSTAQTVTLRGLLTLRSEGMGWGNIAKARGVTLGSVIGPMKSANHEMAILHAHQVESANANAISTNGMAYGAHSSGIVTAAGGPATVHGEGYTHGIVNDMGAMRADAAAGSEGATGHGLGLGHFR